ncbi:hypothetical protein [Chryseobacterium oryctis]|uniref:NUMOD4 motif-containing protein n=1 Tax=Chryseobacterium oryctis TaxID=2952618 RepID=A0ABT3HL35_9FLAO|nr:hypothetical protein [Chryseobacterium oryctis]MCW3160363.1 hypothetical protein [Chryseobacterium oryctis]
MEKIRANIPSKREYLVNENGEVFSPFGKILIGKPNPKSNTLRSIDFMNMDGKRQAMSIPKIVWNTFKKDDLIKEKEIIMLIDQSAEYPFSIHNLRKVSRTENVKRINKIRLDKK